jgi:hypothetical protein
MHALRDELNALVAVVTESLEGLRLQGMLYVPREGHSTPPIEASRESHGGAPASKPVAIPPGPTRAAIAAAHSSARAAPSVPQRPVAERPPAQRAAAPSPPPSVAPEPVSGGLLGRWASQVAGPAERLRRAQAQLGEHCVGCGEPTRQALGGVQSGMALLYDEGSEADLSVLANMLVRVVGVEPADVLTAYPRTCGACGDGLRAQFEAARPRVILALGPLSRALLSAEPGQWTRLAGAPAVGTWHPSEQGADAGRKRAVFEVLKQIAAQR